MAQKAIERTAQCAAGSENCFNTEIQVIAKTIFREPISAEHLARYVDVALQASRADSTSTEDALASAVHAMLLSPSFLFRTELGEPNASEELSLDDHETAAFVSYSLLDEPPDEALREAAAIGSLSDPAVLESHIRRLLAAETRPQRTLNRFLEEYTNFKLYGGSEENFWALAQDTETLLASIVETAWATTFSIPC